MEQVLLAILAVMVGCLLVTLVALWVAVRQLQRRNRVSPTARTPAPTIWLWSPTQAARLHRRLRAAVLVARSCDGDDVRELAAVIEREAVVADTRLGQVGRLPLAARRRALPPVAQEIDRLELLVARLSTLAAQRAPARLPGEPTEVEALAARLDHLEAATRELSDVERAAGLEPPPPPRALPG